MLTRRCRLKRIFSLKCCRWTPASGALMMVPKPTKGGEHGRGHSVPERRGAGRRWSARHSRRAGSDHRFVAGPVGTAMAHLIGDQVKGHSRVFAILNTDVQV